MLFGDFQCFVFFVGLIWLGVLGGKPGLKGIPGFPSPRGMALVLPRHLSSPLVMVVPRTGTHGGHTSRFVCPGGRPGLVGHWSRFVWGHMSRFQTRTGTNVPRSWPTSIIPGLWID